MKLRTAGNSFLLNYMYKNDLIGKLPSSQELALDDFDGNLYNSSKNDDENGKSKKFYI